MRLRPALLLCPLIYALHAPVALADTRVQSLDQVPGAIKTQDAHKLYDAQMSGAPQPDGLGAQLPAGFTDTFLLQQLAPDQNPKRLLVAGAKAPRLVSNDLVSRMLPGSVLVDIAIDQGGCFEDSRPTTHADPTFRVHDSVFYCVTNMPGAVPHTSTYALTNVTLPYVTAVADRGWTEALRADPALAQGLNTHAGKLTNLPVATALRLDATSVDAVLA